MNLRKAFLTLLVLLSGLSLLSVLAVSVSADSYTTFSLNATWTDNTTVSGLVTVDITNGTVASANLTYLGNTFADLLSGSLACGNTAPGTSFGCTPAGGTPVAVAYEFSVGSTTSQFPVLRFIVPGTSSVGSLVDYAGGSICSIDAQCGPDAAGNTWVSAYHADASTGVGLESGSLTPVPEPSVLLLTGTGLLSVTALIRRKLSTRF